jgi:hypothetical protein
MLNFRQMILTGCVVFAEHAGAERLVEELLPQCWEQVPYSIIFFFIFFTYPVHFAKSNCECLEKRIHTSQ